MATCVVRVARVMIVVIAGCVVARVLWLPRRVASTHCLFDLSTLGVSQLRSISTTLATTASGDMPRFLRTIAPGADDPKLSIPITSSTH